MAMAASSARPASRQRMDAHPSGVITEYTECSSMFTRSPTAMASAPPLPPSPVTLTMMGVGRRDISRRLWAMASAWPRSSASSPG